MNKLQSIFKIAIFLIVVNNLLLAQLGSNLLINPGAEDDFTGWTVLANGGSGWASGGFYTPRSGSKCWSSSYLTCTLQQTIDLLTSGYSEQTLDAAPNIITEIYVMSYWHPTPTANYRIQVELLDESDGIVTSWDTGWAILPDNSPWTLKTHTFSGYGSGVRKARMTISGNDGGMWGGSYGTAFDDASVRIDGALPVELTTFTASVSENAVELNWETATEVNNYGFEIEKQSKELNINNQEWENIAFVEGHGNSNSHKYYSFTDNSVEAAGQYSYRLKQVDIDGTFEYSDEVEVSVGSPIEYILNQNYPNPFNPTTSISYSIPVDGNFRLSVFDVLGNEVAVIENKFISAGKYTSLFDASHLTSGIYFYTISSKNFKITKKMLLIK